MTMTSAEHTVVDYFRLAAGPDLEAYFAQFTRAALVEDEGQEYHGIDEIRRWRTTVPPVRYDVLDIVDGPDGATTARADITGDFPGSPVTLTFRFGVNAHGGIEVLTVRT